MFRAVSKILSWWVNTTSSIGGESKPGSTFGSTFPRKVARENPQSPPPPPHPVTTSLIYKQGSGKFTADFYWQVVAESFKLTNKAGRNQSEHNLAKNNSFTITIITMTVAMTTVYMTVL